MSINDTNNTQVVEAKPYGQSDGTFYKAKITHVRWCVSVTAFLEYMCADTPHS